MRRFVVAIAVLALAGSGVIGLASSAFAAGSNPLTGQVESPSPLIVAGNSDIPSGALTFGGRKDSGETITSVQINNPSPTTIDLSDCRNVNTDSGNNTGWVCTYTPTAPGFVQATNSMIEVDYTNSDGSASQTLISFTVVADPETSPAPTAPVAPTFTYKPGGVEVVPTPSQKSGASDGQTELDVYDGEGFNFSQSCPEDTASYTGFTAASDEPPTCDFTLDPGLWLAISQQGNPDEGGEDLVGDDVNTVFQVLTAPNDTEIIKNSDGSVTFRGDESGNPEGQVVVFDQSHKIVCTAPLSGGEGGSTWECSSKVLGVGTHTFTAAAQDEGTGSNLASRVIPEIYGDNFSYYYLKGSLSTPVTLGTVVVSAPATDLSGDTTPTWSFTIGGDLTDVHPGDTLTITGLGLPSGTSLDTELHSVPTDLGTVVAATDGSFTQTVTIPADAPLGAHEIIVTATGPGLVTTTHMQPLTLIAPASTGGTSTVPQTKPTKVQPGNGGADGSGIGAIQPNILTEALTPFADVAVHPTKIVSAIEIGLVLLLLAVLPAHLLNATIAEQSDRFERRFKRLPKRPRWLSAVIGWFKAAPVIGGVVVTVATGILFGFADPKFGFTLASLRLVLACGIALFLVGYVANWLTAVIARTQWHITVAVNTRPYGLILTVVGVLISRVLDFSPGFLIGLILGLTIQGKSAAGFAWRTVVTRTCIVLAMAIGAWIGYSTIELGGHEGGTFGTALLVETFVAIATEGVVALLVELLPFRFLEGERVYAHSRVLWGILYFLSLVVFVLAVVPWEGNWDALGGSLGIWIVVLAAFAVICVGVYVYFRRFAKPLEEDAGGEKVDLAETVKSDRS